MIALENRPHFKGLKIKDIPCLILWSHNDNLSFGEKRALVYERVLPFITQSEITIPASFLVP
jgi:hypothetical protein